MSRYRRDPVREQREKEAAERRSAERRGRWAEQARQIEREATGEAKGFLYAIECGCLWLDRDGKHQIEPTIFDGDRDSAQARAGIDRDRNNLGGGVYHSPVIYPEAMVADRVAFHKSFEKRR